MKFQIPNTIWILGVLHTVEIRAMNDDDPDESDAGGLYKADGRRIVIDQTQPEHLRPEILCHEIAEGINDQLDLGLKHWQISAMGIGFHDVFCNQLEAG